MEIYKPLKDWELSCLAERMSPKEFDQIAIQHMGIRKVCVFRCFIDTKLLHFSIRRYFFGYESPLNLF